MEKEKSEEYEDWKEWLEYERDRKCNSIAHPLLFILAELSKIVETVNKSESDIENLREEITTCTENITSISNELAGYDP